MRYTPIRGGRRRTPPLDPRSATIALSFTLLGLLLAFGMALASNSAYHDDDLTHFLYARWSTIWPAYLLDDWGRPGFTLLYALPAQLGWLPCRLLSALLTGLTAWLCFLSAKRLRISFAWTTPAFLWLQPLVFTLSYTTLTETVLAFYLILGYWLYQTRRFAAAAAVVSLCVVTRHEGAVFIALFAVGFLLERRGPRDFLLLLWAPVLHNILSWLLLGEAPVSRFFHPAPTDEYGTGTWHAMSARWVLAAGIGVLMLAIPGAVRLWQRRAGRLLLCCGGAYVLAHIVLYRFGLFATGGYERFLVGVGPVVAIAACAGLAWYVNCARDAMRSPAMKKMLSKPDERRRPGPAVAIAITTVATAYFWYAAAVEVRADAPWLLDRVHRAFGALVGAGLLALALLQFRLLSLRQIATVLVPAAALFATVYQPIASWGFAPPHRYCAPLRYTPYQRLLRDAAAWVKREGADERPLAFANVWFTYLLHRPHGPDRPSTRRQLEALPPGGLFIWDARECTSPRHEIPLRELVNREEFVCVFIGDEHPDGNVYCYIFERRAER